MFGAHRRGFDWKEIAKVLRVTPAVGRATFWREIKRSRSKSVAARTAATVIRDESDSDTRKSANREHLAKRSGAVSTHQWITPAVLDELQRSVHFDQKTIAAFSVVLLG
jgi:hypothetical protein